MSDQPPIPPPRHMTRFHRAVSQSGLMRIPESVPSRAERAEGHHPVTSGDQAEAGGRRRDRRALPRSLPDSCSPSYAIPSRVPGVSLRRWPHRPC